MTMKGTLEKMAMWLSLRPHMRASTDECRTPNGADNPAPGRTPSRRMDQKVEMRGIDASNRATEHCRIFRVAGSVIGGRDGTGEGSGQDQTHFIMGEVRRIAVTERGRHQSRNRSLLFGTVRRG